MEQEKQKTRMAMWGMKFWPFDGAVQASKFSVPKQFPKITERLKVLPLEGNHQTSSKPCRLRFFRRMLL